MRGRPRPSARGGGALSPAARPPGSRSFAIRFFAPRLLLLATLPVRRAWLFALVAVLGGAAIAAPVAGYEGALGPAARTAAAVAARAAPRLEQRVVIPRGVDADGDGAADFVNPTGRAIRGSDAFGYGGFHASRDEGARLHEGADYLAAAGQTIVAPISGYVTRIGYAYNDDPAFRYVELTNPAIGYAVRVFYVEPVVAIGDAVRLGHAIGASMTLQSRYPGISDHVHVEVTRIGQGHVDPASVIPSPVLKWVRVRRAARG